MDVHKGIFKNRHKTTQGQRLYHYRLRRKSFKDMLAILNALRQI